MDSKLFSLKKFSTLVVFVLLIAALIVTPVLAALTTPIFAFTWGAFGTEDGQFNSPAAIEASTTRVYVADTNNNRVQIFTRDGTFVSKIGPSFTGDGGYPLRQPQGVAVDSSGNIYVADTRDRIMKFGANLAYQTKTGAIGLFGPSGLAVDPTGEFLYVADTFNSRVLKLNTSDLTLAREFTAVTLNQPKDVAVNTAGTYIFVADTENNRVAKIDASTGAATYSNATLNSKPASISVDANNMVYVAETGLNRFTKLNESNFAIVKTWGSYGTTNGLYNSPKGVTALGEDMLYVADTNNNRVQYLEPNVPMTDLDLSNTEVLEGNSPSMVIATLSTVDENLMDVFTYALVTDSRFTCTDNSAFAIAGNSLKANNKVYDYETKSTYNICIRVYDSYNQNLLIEPFVITILNGSDAPLVTSATTVSTLGEYTARTGTGNIVPDFTTLQPQISVFDNDLNDDMTFTIIGGSFADAFKVEKVSNLAPKLVVKDNGATPPAYQTLLDYETAPGRSGTVIVQVTDSKPAGQTTSVPVTFTVPLSNQVDPPVVHLPEQPFEVDEFAPYGTVVGPAGVDCTGTPTPPACMITLKDQDSTITQLNLSINLPTWYQYFQLVKDGCTAGVSPDLATCRWKIITIKSLPGHLTNPVMTLKMIATDNGNTSSNTAVWFDLPINVLDSNNSPVLLSDYFMHEDRHVGFVLDLATDPDVDDTLTYEILSGNTGNTFVVDDLDGQIKIADETLINYAYWQAQTPPYFELSIRVQDDGDPPSDPLEGTVNIHITEGNRPPVFVTNPAPSLTTPESTLKHPLGPTVVGYVSATDLDFNQLTFSTDSATNPDNPFLVNTTCTAPCSAAVTVNLARLSKLNFEAATSYSLPVTVDDGAAPPVTHEFTVSITNINEPIEITNKNLDLVIGDRTPVETVIGTILWSDEDGNANTTPIFYISGGGDEHFGINSAGGVYILPTANLHYYQQNVFTPMIQVYDLPSGGFSDYTTEFSITLTDQNDPPSFKAFQYKTAPVNSLKENEPNGTEVGSFIVFDENGNDFTVEIDGGDGAFSITTEPANPEISNGITMIHKKVTVWVADTTRIDYDTAPDHKISLTLRGTDTASTPLSGTHTYDITLTNVNEAPVLLDQQFFTYQNALQDVVVGTLVTHDPDAGTIFNFEIVDPHESGDTLFALEAATGKIKVKPGVSPQVMPGDYTMTVRVRDNAPSPLYSENAVITITVTPKADPAVKNLTVPAAELLIGSAMRYTVTATNEALGVSSDFALQLKLPVGVGFVPTGSTTGCAMKTADTVECPGEPLEPKGATGDSINYVINAYLYSNAPTGALLTTVASLVLSDTLNDLSAANNTDSESFTGRRSITITYQDFEGLALPQDFTKNSLALNEKTTAPSCPSNNNNPQSFAGLFKNDQVKYTKNVISHSQVEVSFDLYLPYTWDGVHSSLGPDRWKFCIGSCTAPTDIKVDTTFSNMPDVDGDLLPVYPQSFPKPYDAARTFKNPAMTGSSQRNTLGYHLSPTSTCGGDAMDSVYSFNFKFDHADPTLILNFIAAGLQEVLPPAVDREEKWGIDNLRVVIYGEKSYQTFLPMIRR